METAIKSEKILLEAIAKGEVTNTDQVRALVKDKDLWFGPECSWVEVLVINESLGIIRWDRETGKIWRRKKEGKGDWFLEYHEFDKMENVEGLVIEKVPLDADNETEALKMAKALWEERLAKGTYKGWNGATYPQHPRLLCEYIVKLD